MHPVRFIFAPAVALAVAVMTTPAIASTDAPPAEKSLQLQSGTSPLSTMDASQLGNELLRLQVDDRSTHGWIRFHQPPTKQERQRIEAAGLRILAPVGPGGFTVALQPEVDIDQITATRLLAEIRGLDTTWKMHWSLLEGLVPTWTVDTRQQQRLIDGEPIDVEQLLQELAHSKDPVVALYVLLHKDVELAEAAQELTLATGGVRRSLIKSINGIVLEVPFSQAWTLAEDDRVRWVEPALPKFDELNDSNRVITETDEVQDSPYGLDGEGVVVMVYDGGYAYSGHEDFGGRLTTRDDAGTSDHATHVSGTIGGDGSASAGLYRGMAPGVTIESYGFEQEGGLEEGFLYTDPGDLEADYSDAINTYGAVISNNSIGTNTAPNGFPCEWTGDYGVTSNLIDSVVRGELGAPIRVFWANGNERGTDRCGSLYYTTAPPACAKNHITVGAMNSNDDSVTYFTSWGPTDDGRIKPDISAPGCQSDGDGGVTSCSSSGGYSSKCGTSMASPTACGIGALLIQDHRNQYPDAPEMANSTMKALLAHTAFDAGNVGPDCQYGYGSIRSKAAIDHLRGGSFIEAEIGQNESYNFLIVVPDGAERFQVTAAWDDVPAEPLLVPSLVNDIDVVVHGPDGTRHYPWSINPDDPGAPATRSSEDHLNNIEQVTVANPAAGIWSIELVGTVVTTDSQLVSIATSPDLIDCSSSGIVALDRNVYPLEGGLTVRVVDCDLNTDDQLVELLEIDVCSDLECETVLLIESGEATSEFVGFIQHSVTDAPAGVLQVADGGTISTTYSDASDNDGNPAQVSDQATVDGTPPLVDGVDILSVEPQAATIEVRFNEPCQVNVDYATSCGSAGESKSASAYETVHVLTLSGLDNDTNYYFSVTGVDRAGNAVDDDNDGDCFTFMTTPVPDYFTEQFNSGIDLAGSSIRFTPNGNIDSYRACGESIDELPVDPSGGNSVSLSDDDSEEISPGQPVWLYGTAWDSFYINSNGSITFQSGDSTYGESLSSHFSDPRISALWDDLNPSSGGSVSWKQTLQSIVVTFENVPEYGSSNSNTFQIEMFESGDLQLSWLNIDSGDAVVGLSAGDGSDPDYIPSDLSGYDGECDAQPGDINGDGLVGVDDLLIVIANWGSCDSTECPGDLNGDGMVGVDDLLIVIANWGPGRRSSGEDELARDMETESNSMPDTNDEPGGLSDLYVNDDVLAPVWDGGLTRVDSDYLQTSDGVLEIELVDTVPIDGHDVLSVGGSATLGGGLSVRFGEGCMPRAGDRFGILMATEIQSEFDWFQLPENIDEGLEIVLCYQPGVVFIEIRHRVERPMHSRSRPMLHEADLDRNGVVNAVDLVLLMQDWGRGGFHDINGDGRFGPLDMLAVMDHIQGCEIVDSAGK